MAVKYGYMPIKGYTKLDNDICRIRDLSDAAVRFYIFVAGLKNGMNVNDGYVVKALGWSQSKVTRCKKELKKYDLIRVEQIHRGLSYLYIGNVAVGASTVKQYVQDNEIDTLTLEDIERKHKRTQSIVEMQPEILEEIMSGNFT